MDAVPDDVISKHLWLLVLQSAVILAVFLIPCLWLCHINRSLELKLNAIQTTLSSQTYPISSRLSCTAVATTSAVQKQQKQTPTEQDSNIELNRRTKLCSQNGTHTRSLSLTSATDLQRQAENIGDLSRVELKSLATTRSTSWQENGYSSELACATREISAISGGPLASHSLSSLDERRASVEVGAIEST